MKRYLALLPLALILGCSKDIETSNKVTMTVEAPIYSAKMELMGDGNYTLRISVWSWGYVENFFCGSLERAVRPDYSYSFHDLKKVSVTIDPSKDEAFLRVSSKDCNYSRSGEVTFDKAEVLVPSQKYADAWNKRLGQRRVKKVVLPELNKD